MGRLICQSCYKVLDSNYPTKGDSHGTCVPCGRMLYPMIDWDRIEREKKQEAQPESNALIVGR